MTAPSACMILAAGFGTRMGALVADRPKPLIEVAGRALIDHALDQARGVGASPIIVNGHYMAEAMGRHLSAHPDTGFVIETPDILDSGGGLRNAAPQLGGGPVWTLNADAVWKGDNALACLRAHWRPEVMDALLLMVPQDRATGRTGAGDFLCDPEGRLIRSATGLVYTGAQIIDLAALDDAPPGPFSLNLIWDRLAARGRLHGVEYGGRWADVGHPAGIALAEKMLEDSP